MREDGVESCYGQNSAGGCRRCGLPRLEPAVTPFPPLGKLCRFPRTASTRTGHSFTRLAPRWVPAIPSRWKEGVRSLLFMREEKGVRSLLFFDPMGRAWAEKQCTPATCGLTPYSLTMSYNFLGNETGYSDGAYSRSTGYDSTDRLNGFSVNNQSLLSDPQYYPYGLKQVTLGNGLTENRNYDPNRLWLTSIQVGSTGNPTSAYSLGLGYYTNGNIYTANDSVNGNWTYQYDNVNRLQKATIGGQNFNYYYTADGSNGQFGNMTCTAPSGYACTPLGLSFNPSNNQINSSGYQLRWRWKPVDGQYPRLRLRPGKPHHVRVGHGRHLHVVQCHAVSLRRRRAAGGQAAGRHAGRLRLRPAGAYHVGLPERQRHSLPRRNLYAPRSPRGYREPQHAVQRDALL